MSLPSSFNEPADYFEQCISFFKKYQYLYTFPNTCILVNNVLDLIGIENTENVDIFSKNFKLSNLNDCYVQKFLADAEKFKAEFEVFEESDCLLDLGDVPLGPKKKHEIFHLGKEIDNVCEASNCQIVVDFGSGLGYLDQYLHQTTDLKVLGLECNESHYVGAKKRQIKYHSRSKDSVKYIKHTVSENSDENIRAFLRDKFPNDENFCMTGLHACGDLTIESMNLFLKMQEAKATVLMPCCYHKMRIKPEDGGFCNFPLSACLQSIFQRQKGYEFLRIPFLRLAAQPLLQFDGNLENVVFNLLSRAVIQLYAHKNNFRIKRNKRKAVKLKAVKDDFEAYIQEAKIGFSITSESDFENSDTKTIDLDEEELKNIWNAISEPKYLKRAAIFVLLQNQLQPIFEHFVLFDRLLYLKENGICNSRIKKVFNERISPRCLALVAFK